MRQREIDETFMRAALDAAQKALDAGEFPVGCVIAGPEGVAATGGRRCSKGSCANEIDHAEIMALRNLYESGFSGEISRLTMYCTMEPCLMCFGAALIAGIRRLVYAYEDVMGGGTGCSLESLPPLYRESKVQVVAHILREESMELFCRFFSDPQNTYLQGTLLAEYTLCRK